jgi:ubiquinone/menaquinone biosynthesis C-methylase UbiE
MTPRSLVRTVYHPAFRLWIRTYCFLADVLEGQPDTHFPPAMLRFRVSESVSREEFTRIGQGCARLISSVILRSGVQLTSGDRVLDFGCGCGRTLRWLTREHPGVEFHGTDVDQEAIAWCSENIPSVKFAVGSAMPPSGFADGYFRAVYCFSVFTHLDRDMQDAWLPELHRLLMPGGVLVITVHGANAQTRLTDTERAKLRASGLLHKKSRKLHGMVPDWYHTTWHSREHITSQLSRWFRKVQYVEVPDGMQDIVVAFERRAIPER